MKKRILILFAVILFCLTGCIKYNAVMDIKEDKSMDFSIIYAMQKSLMEMSDDATILSDEDRKNLEDNGFSIEDYSDEKMVGFRISKMISNIDDVSSNEDVEYSLSKIMETNTSKDLMFKIEKGSDKDIYTANFSFDASDSELSDSELSDSSEDSGVTVETEGEMEGLDQLGDAALSSLDLKFIVKLPNAAISDNATSKSEDRKELTWDLSAQKKENISFQFAINHSAKSSSLTTVGGKGKNFESNILLYVIIGGCVGLVLVVLILIIVKNSSKNRKLSNEGNMNSSTVDSVNNSFSVSEAEVKVDTPSVEVGTSVSAPEVKVDTPSVEVGTSVSAPEVKVDTPSVEVGTSVSVPEVKVDTPSVEVGTSASNSIFPPEVSSGDVEGSTNGDNDKKVDNSEIFPNNGI